MFVPIGSFLQHSYPLWCEGKPGASLSAAGDLANVSARRVGVRHWDCLCDLGGAKQVGDWERVMQRVESIFVEPLTGIGVAMLLHGVLAVRAVEVHCASDWGWGTDQGLDLNGWIIGGHAIMLPSVPHSDFSWGGWAIGEQLTGRISCGWRLYVPCASPLDNLIQAEPVVGGKRVKAGFINNAGECGGIEGSIFGW
ncbi:hypothetical protein Tco_0404806 [Tanacetum coccineum]